MAHSAGLASCGIGLRFPDVPMTRVCHDRRVSQQQTAALAREDGVDEHQDLVAAADFDPEPSAVAAARHFVRDRLVSWGLPGGDDRVADAVLLASELVTNAVVHAGTQVQLTCRLSGTTVEVSVLDRHPARVIPDLPIAADVDRPSGRGLLLPAALSSSWGVTYAPETKAIWFRLGPDSTADGQSAAAPPVAQALPDRLGGGFAQAADRGVPQDLLQLGYDELLGHAVTLAREAVTADAAYALVADEDGELRMRAAAGGGIPQLQVGASAEPGAGSAGMGTFLDLYNRFAERGADLAQVQNEPRLSLLTVPLAVEGRVTGMLAVAAAAPDRFAEADLARVQQVVDRVALPLERARLTEHDRIRRARLSFLAEASDLLAGSLDQEKTIALAAQLVVPRLAAWCAALLPEENGELSPAYVWHADESLADTLTSLLNAAPAPEVGLGDGAREWSLGRLPAEPGSPAAAELASDPAWCFPLVARDRSLGAFVIGRPRGGALAREAVELAEDLTRRVALALDNARLYSEQLQATNALQRSLLPPELPDIPGVELAAGYEAAGEGNEVGGDFYDVFEAKPGRWRFAIGDVCGKGPEAAAVTGLTRHALRILAREGHDVPTVLERLNALIVDEGSRARFITLIHGELVPAAGPGEPARVSLVCAGHPPPLMLRSAGGVEAVADSQPLLGVLEGVTFEQNTFSMAPSDVLLCVTDGVTERRAGDRLLDDDDGLRNLLGGCSELNAGSVVARIQRAVREFGAEPPTDDLALLVLRGL
jgi:serine phosphatase RsbU (regulator of sigma subunit)/anti-sigma regulatory factor (Ser/Thr protein kinase)